MDHSLIVHVLETQNHIGQHEFGLVFIESPTLAYVVTQISACQQVTNQVEGLSILKSVVDIH